MMMKKIFCFQLLLLFFLPSAGCVQIKQPYIESHQYTLEYDSPEFGDLHPLPVILQVERFTASPVYDTNRMVYRDRDFAREEYAYHRWRTRPASLIQNFLVRDLTRSSLFRAVFSDPTFSPDYSLTGKVEEFLEWDQEERWLAVFTLTVSLFSLKGAGGELILFQEVFSSRQPAARKEPRAIAEAMSLAMAEVSGEVIRAIYEAIAFRELALKPDPAG
jgi:ABC-type uncharacterized transport system auxiliary subunit